MNEEMAYKKILRWTNKALITVLGTETELMPVQAATRMLRLCVWIPPESCLSVVNAVCCQEELSAMGLSLAQRSPTDCGASLRVI